MGVKSPCKVCFPLSWSKEKPKLSRQTFDTIPKNKKQTGYISDCSKCLTLLKNIYTFCEIDSVLRFYRFKGVFGKTCQKGEKGLYLALGFKVFPFKFSQFFSLKFVMDCPKLCQKSTRNEKKNILIDSEIKLWPFQKKTKMNALQGEFNGDNTNHMLQVCDVNHIVHDASCTWYAPPAVPTSTNNVYCDGSYSQGRWKGGLCEPQSNFWMSSKKTDILGYNIALQSKYVGWRKGNIKLWSK